MEAGNTVKFTKVSPTKVSTIQYILMASIQLNMSIYTLSFILCVVVNTSPPIILSA